MSTDPGTAPVEKPGTEEPEAEEPEVEVSTADEPEAAPAEPALRLGISSCLLGEEVRFDGGHKRDAFLVKTLGRYVSWHPICPEVEIGLGTPRESLRLVGAKDAPRLIGNRSGTDHTDTMNEWAASRLEEVADWNLHGYVLKRASPSCGLFRVKLYTTDGMPNPLGRGIFAAALRARFPLLPVEEEGRLHDPRLRENFIERIFAYERWTRFLRDDPAPRGLVAFHTAHKLTVMSHSPEHYRRLGRVTAKAGGTPWEELIESYGRLMAEGLSVLATRGRHTNVLHHVLGFLKDALSAGDKQEILGQIEDYRQGLVPLVVPLTLIRHHLRRHPVPPWIEQQVYLNPYPKELMLRNHV